MNVCCILSHRWGPWLIAYGGFLGTIDPGQSARLSPVRGPYQVRYCERYGEREEQTPPADPDTQLVRAVR